MPTSRFAMRSLLPLVLLLWGCGDDGPTSPGVNPEISNLPDNFQYQVTNVQNYTNIATYTWQNTGTQANVDQSTTVTGGTATLVIRDATDAQVYSRSLADNGSFTTTVGAPGSWTIRVLYSAADANVNFRVQKTT